MPTLNAKIYVFEDFRFDTGEKTLKLRGMIIPITPKVFETLQLFVENAGHLIEKDELMSRLWQDRFVEESNLTFNIKMLRKALGDDASNPKFIETVPRRGYRFIAKIENAFPQSLPSPDHDGPREVIPGPVSWTNRGNAARPATVIALADWRHDAEIESPDPAEKRAELGLVPPSSPPRTRTRAFRYIFAAIPLVGLTIIVVYGAYRYFAVNSANEPFSAVTSRRLTSSGKTNLAVVSPDGKFVVHVKQVGDSQSIWLRQVASEGETQVTAPAKISIRAINVSPDSSGIFYTTGETNFRGTVYRTNILGGQPRKVVENVYLPKLSVKGVGFSPDGKQIAFVRLSPPPNDASYLMIADADGTNERSLISYKRPDLLHGLPAWSPDGKLIVCPTQNANGMNAVAFDVENAAAAAILPTELNSVAQALWLPDGKNLIFVAEDDLQTVLNQIYRVSLADGSRRRVNHDFNNYESVSLSADGQTIVAVRTEQNAHIWTMPSEDQNQIRQLTDGFEKYDGINSLGWLANGKIVYESMPGGKHATLQIDADGTGETQLGNSGGYGSVSPDGRMLVYQKSFAREGRLMQGLFLFDMNRGEERQLTTGWDIWAEFAPDGRSVNFIRWGEDEAVATLRSVSTEGGDPVHLTKFLAITATMSPDGRSIAIARWNGANTQIVIIPAVGGEAFKTFDLDFAIQDRFGKRNIRWTADGRGIDFIRDVQNVSNVWRLPIEGGDPQEVTAFKSDLIFNFAFSPDEKSLALSRGSVGSDVVIISASQ